MAARRRVALGVFAWSAVVVMLAVILVTDGLPLSFAAFAVGVVGISQLAGRVLYGPLERWIGLKLRA